jgi:hypothetical protein
MKKNEMGVVCGMGDRRGAYGFLVGKPEGRRQFGRPGCRWEDLKKWDEEDIDWIDLAKGKKRWRTLANAVMNLWVP